MTISYAKTRDGDWAVIGPQGAIRKGRTVIVTVTTKAGKQKSEYIAGVSRPFNGKRFGYLGSRPSPTPSDDWDDDYDCDCGVAGSCGCVAGRVGRDIHPAPQPTRRRNPMSDLFSSEVYAVYDAGSGGTVDAVIRVEDLARALTHALGAMTPPPLPLLAAAAQLHTAALAALNAAEHEALNTIAIGLRNGTEKAPDDPRDLL